MRNGIFRVAVVSSALIIVASGVIAATTVSSAAVTPTYVNATADAYVSADTPDTNYGTATSLTVRAPSADKAEAVAYVKFSVTGLSAAPSAVQLQLYSYAQSSTGVQLYTAGSDWTEPAVTWNTRPVPGGTMVANMAGLTLNAYATADVSSVITGNGTYTFAITTTSTLSKQLASREVTADPPRLLVTAADATTPPTPSATTTSPSASPSASPSPSVSASPSASPSPTTSGTPTTYTFKATADSYVRSDDPSSTPGSEFVLGTEAGSPTTPTLNAYVRFNVTGVTGTITSATLQLYSYATSALGVLVSRTTPDWTEAALTYASAPAVGAQVGAGPNIAVNTWASIGLGSAVAGNGGYDFALTTTRTANNKFASRESSATPPTLVVTAVSGGTTTSTTPTPTPTTPSVSPSASPTVTSPAPAGSAITPVGGDGQRVMAGRIFAAPLAAKVTDGGNPVAGVAVTFTAPAGGASATFPGGASTVTVTTDASGVATTPPVTAGTTTGTYAVTASAGTVSATFSLTNSDPMIVAAGDIACTAGKTPTATSCQQQATSDLALSLHPDAVLPLGDDQYELGSLSDYQSMYDPGWGRLNSISYPVPGNHEYGYIGTDVQPTGGTGYFTYFGDRSHPLDPGCTTLCKSWYSYDIGSWHLIALDSQCAVVGGCNPGNPQYQWLLSDLNAHASSTCTLAYWHIPIYSSSQDHQPDMQAIYSLLYTKGADVVLTGHAHFYERFGPQDGAGNADAAKGVAQFIVGSGGRNFFSIRPTPAANSAARIANTFGVLQMTLSNGSYGWKFVAANTGGSTDSGTGGCH
ncbi:DUF7594 domain-containing protein [Actinoplanes sp. CA-030573]|uniref:CBM96 family carbohydrate-binding protein n=1 Tax=Actinoplanes sp. CA-030573 TaxID=3239898 RepID=UPI003D936C23